MDTETTREPEQSGDVLRRLGDDARLWAAEFRATAIRLGYSDMDEGWLIGWFANAIEHSNDVRRSRAERDAASGKATAMDTATTPWDLPANCIAEINGNLVCEDGDGRFDVFARGVGWWAFRLSREAAIRNAETVAVPGCTGRRFRPDQAEAE